MDSACLRLISCVLAGCGPNVPVGDEGDSTSEAHESSSSSSAAESTSSTSPPSTTTTTTTTTTPATTAGPGPSEDSSSTGGEDPFEALCRDDGQFAAAASGSNEKDHEGRLIWLSAVEPSFEDPEGAPDPIIAHMQATIADGAFELECPLGLTENSAYPSVAVIIDANDDGVCSEGDVAFVQQLFAWNAEQRYSFDGASVYSHETDPPWLISENAWQPVEGLMGFNGEPFCDYYVP